MKRLSAHTSIFRTLMLAVLMIASPLADNHPDLGALLALITVATVVLGAIDEGNRPTVVFVGIPVVIVWAGARLLEVFGSRPQIATHLAHLLGFSLSCTIVWALSDRMHRASSVTSHVLADAVMIYLVIATAFSQIYWILSSLIEHAFSHVIRQSESSTLLYFSLVTLTGLGDGDLTPTNPYIRMTAAFESVLGLFYLAFVVARLVSSYSPKGASESAAQLITDKHPGLHSSETE